MKYNFDEIINRNNTDCIKWDYRNLVFGCDDVIPLWVADMDFKTPDFIMEAIRKRAEHEVMGYSYRPELFFESARNWIMRRNGWQTEIKDMAFTPGIVPAINFAVNALTNKGDKIIIQPPVYTPFFGAVNDHERVLVENELLENDGYYTINFDDLEQKLADNAKMLILCNPHNPVGRVWTNDELLRIGKLCVKYNVVIISDEIHSDLVFKPNKHIHLASLSNEIANLTLTCLAPSKTFNIAGLSTAIVHSCNADILKAFNNKVEIYHANLGNVFGNVALEAAYKYGDEWLNQLLGYIDANMDWVVSYLNKNIPQIKARKSEGTYLMWLDFSSLKMSQSKLNDFLIQKAKLGLNNGITFGKYGIGFMRLNVACPRKILEKAMEQLKEAIADI